MISKPLREDSRSRSSGAKYSIYCQGKKHNMILFSSLTYGNDKQAIKGGFKIKTASGAKYSIYCLRKSIL